MVNLQNEGESADDLENLIASELVGIIWSLQFKSFIFCKINCTFIFFWRNLFFSVITVLQVKRPKDAELRAKLLRMYLDTGRVNEAYTHAVDVESKQAYPDSISWCHAVLEVFEVRRVLYYSRHVLYCTDVIFESTQFYV